MWFAKTDVCELFARLARAKFWNQISTRLRTSSTPGKPLGQSQAFERCRHGSELFKKAPPSDPAGLTPSNKADLFGAAVSELLQQEVEKRLPRHQRKIRPRAFSGPSLTLRQGVEAPKRSGYGCWRLPAWQNVTIDILVIYRPVSSRLCRRFHSLGNFFPMVRFPVARQYLSPLALRACRLQQRRAPNCLSFGR
jgi:hypothetical protein